jgi:hypothetical protein
VQVAWSVTKVKPILMSPVIFFSRGAELLMGVAKADRVAGQQTRCELERPETTNTAIIPTAGLAGTERASRLWV